MSEHICKPKPTTMFSVLNYQCGCGKYFSPKSVLGDKEYLHKHFQDIIEYLYINTKFSASTSKSKFVKE